MVWPLMVAGAAMQVYGAMKSGSAMKSAARAQARAHLMTAEENIRRKGLQYTEMRKQTTAGIYASGVEMSGSSENYLRKMRTEMSRELAWQRMAAQVTAAACLAAGVLSLMCYFAAAWLVFGRVATSVWAAGYQAARAAARYVRGR